jgi:SAM-dependent methyltransferase
MGDSMGTDYHRADRFTTARRRLDAVFSATLRPLLFHARQGRDRLIDRRYGIDTSGQVFLDEHSAERRRFYKPTPWGPLGRILPADHVGPEDVFIDFGCGKGRIVFLAARYPFKRVIGVEFSEELSKIARENVERARKYLRSGDVEIVTCDALDYEIPDDVTVAFFANPFTGETFETVIRRLLGSVDRRPRPLRIVYHTPEMEDFLRSTGRVRLVRVARAFRPTREWARTYETHLYEVLPAAPASSRSHEAQL